MDKLIEDFCPYRGKLCFGSFCRTDCDPVTSVANCIVRKTLDEDRKDACACDNNTSCGAYR